MCSVHTYSLAEFFYTKRKNKMTKLTQRKTKVDMPTTKADMADHLLQLLPKLDTPHPPKTLKAKLNLQKNAEKS